MRGRRKLLWIPFIMALLVNMTVISASGAETTALAAPIVMNTALTPGSAFYIDITVEDVTAMWGYDLTLEYDTTVLTATAFSSYPPFFMPWPSEINDTAGWVKASYSMPFGEPVGFSTVAPAPILRIDFTVDALGWSFFDLYDTEISDIYGEPIYHEVVDGLFANIEPQYMCNLVRKSAWPEHHHWVESKDPDQTLYALVRNIGSLPTTAYVVFTVHNDDALWQTTFTTATVLLKPKQIAKLDDVAITPADLIGYGKYYVNAQCWYDDGTGTYVPGIKIKSFAFALVP